MKKALLTLALVATASTAFGQLQTVGDIFFYNEGITDAQGNPYDAVIRNPNGTPVSGAGFTAGIFLAGAPESAVPIASTTFANGGIFAEAATVLLTGTVPGQQAALEIRVYETGQTYASSQLRGSQTFTSQPLGGPNGANPAFPTPGLTGFTGFTLVPEPSTYALGMLGLGALALMRRRKA